MTNIQKKTLTIFIILTIASLGMAGGIPPKFEAFDQVLLLATGMTLFGSSLAVFLIKFLEESK